MQKPNTNLIIVNYRGGYGGDFFANILHNAIDPKFNVVVDNSGFNKYKVTNKHGWFSCLKHIGLLVQRHRDQQNGRPTQMFFAHRGEAWIWADKIYRMSYDPDIKVFSENLKEVLREQLTYPQDEVIVTNYHNMFPNNFELFEMGHVFPQSKGIFLYADSYKYHCLFDLLGSYKTKYLFLLRSALDYGLYSGALIGGQPKRLPNDKSLPVDVGRLFFDLDTYDQVNEDLSNHLGCKIVLNKDAIVRYRENNLKIIEDTIGNVDQFTDVELKTRIERHMFTTLAKMQ